jgi:hypothetical protein
VRFDQRTLPALLYWQGSWPLIQQDTFVALAGAPDHLSVFFLYCDPHGLTQVWFETTSGVPVQVEDASGPCATRATKSAAAVALPATRLQPGPLVPGFTVMGADIEYDGHAEGRLLLDGEPWQLRPFNLLDCSTGCGDPGAYELHSLLWNPGRQRACFGILYLDTPPSGQVSVDLGLCLPDLTTLSQRFAATYTHPAG